MTTRKLVSLIVPMFDESENIPHLIEHIDRIRSANPSYDFELIAVDDGSLDSTSEKLRAQAPEDWKFTIVRLARNFGSHSAASAGFEYSNGDCVVVLGADMQEPVDVVGKFLDAWEQGSEVVWGIRASRAQAGLSLVASRFFSWLFNRFSEIESYPAQGPSAVLCARPVVDAVNSLRERNRNLYGLIAWVGFRQAVITYDQRPRLMGRSKWSRRKLFKLALDSFVQFSSSPIRAAGIVGGVVALSGFMYAAFLIVRVTLGSSPPEGWTTVVVLVLIIGGLQLMFLSLFGEYLWRTTDEARQRPLYVIAEVGQRSPGD